MHDLIDTKSRVIVSRTISRAHSSAERKMCLAMLDDVLAKQESLGLPKRPEIISLDGGYGTGAMAAALIDRGLLPHMPLQASVELEPVPQWKQPTYNLQHARSRRERVQVAKARNRVRELQKTRGYTVSRSLRTRSEHTFAEAKTRHGMGRAQFRGEDRVLVQAILTGAVQNLKRLAGYRGRRRPTAAQRGSVSTPCCPPSPLCAPRARREGLRHRRVHGRDRPVSLRGARIEAAYQQSFSYKDERHARASHLASHCAITKCQRPSSSMYRKLVR